MKPTAKIKSAFYSILLAGTLFFYNKALAGTRIHYSDHIYLTVKASISDTTKPLVFLFTGDGGWRPFDEKLADALNKENIPIIGFNSLKYFRRRKTPEQVAKDITVIINEYMEKWNKKKFILVGYSFGAEVVPFVYNHLSSQMKHKITLITLLTPSDNSDFKTHIADRIGLLINKWPYNVVNQITSIKGIDIICVWGKEEKSIFPENYIQNNVKIVFIKGGHNFKDANTIMQTIWNKNSTI